MNLSPPEIDEYNRLYGEATTLMRGEIHLDGHELPPPGWFVRRRLRKAKARFEAAIAIYPVSWQSVFFIGKILQRLGDKREALDWMRRAQEIDPENPSIAKEIAMTAGHLGMHQLAAQVADRALSHAPVEPGLLVNAGVAHLLSGHADIALERFREAARVEPERAMNQKLALYAERVIARQCRAPKTEAEIVAGIKMA